MANGGEVIFKFLGDDKNLNKTLDGIKNVGVSAMKGLATATIAATAAFTALVAASVKARGEMEQLEGGAKKIFDEMDYSKIEKDAQEAYKTMNLSAAEYLRMINNVGATFAQTMGDEQGYETAKKGMQAISDYASGTGADIDLLNDKYKLITRSAGSYQSICDQFAGILPQTSKDFLKQAQEAGLLSKKYKQLTDVPVAEYQQAVTEMLERGVDQMGLLGNTAAETEQTLTGSITATQKAWENFLSGSGGLDQVVQIGSKAVENILRVVQEIIPDIANALTQNLPMLIQVGMQLIGEIAKGVFQNIPLLMDTMGQVLMTLVDTIIENLPQIIDTGFEILMKLIEGITNALPELIPKVAEIITTIVVKLVEHAPDIIAASVKLMIALAEGIIKSLPTILEAIGKVLWNILQTIASKKGEIREKGLELIKKMAQGFKDGVSNALSSIGQVLQKIWEKIKAKFQEIINNAKQWGRDMISGFTSGVEERLGSLQSRVDSVASSIRSKLHFSRPDEGPLRDYETWMPDMIEGLARSLDKASPLLLSKVHALSSEMAMSMSPSLNGNVNNSLSPIVNVVVNNNMEQDPLGQIVSQIKTFSNGAKNDYNYGYGG